MSGRRFVGFVTLALAACSGAHDAADYGEDGPVATLERGVTFAVDAAEGGVGLVARRKSYAESREMLALRTGTVSLRAEGDHILLDELTFGLEDVEVDESAFPPNGLSFSGVRVRLAEPARVLALYDAPGSVAVGEGSMDVLLDWSLVVDGTSHALASQRIDGVSLHLEIHEADDGTLAVQITGLKTGVFWRWGGMVELEDLVIDLTARQ